MWLNIMVSHICCFFLAAMATRELILCADVERAKSAGLAIEEEVSMG